MGQIFQVTLTPLSSLGFSTQQVYWAAFRLQTATGYRTFSAVLPGKAANCCATCSGGSARYGSLHAAVQVMAQQHALVLLATTALLFPAACAAVELKVAAESNGKTAKLACTGWGGISISSATFGKSCFGERTDGCTTSCTANCAGCNAVACPAVPGTAAGKCSDPDVTAVVAAACDGRGACDFPICITDVKGTAPGDPNAATGTTCDGSGTTPATKHPLGDPGYGCRKEFIVEYECSAWGWNFLALVVIGGGGYVSARTYHNRSARGLQGTAALPHRAQLDELQALVADGVAFSKAVARGQVVKPRGGGYSRVGESSAETTTHEKKGAKRPRGEDRSEKKKKKEEKKEQKEQKADAKTEEKQAAVYGAQGKYARSIHTVPYDLGPFSH